MKRNKGKKISFLIAPWLLLAASCSESYESPESNTGSDENGLATVSFTVKMPKETGGRAENASHISDGSKVDMLVYAIYDVTDGEVSTSPLPYYQENYGEGKDAGKGHNFENIRNKPSSIPAGHTYVGFGAQDTYRIVLKVNPDKKYRIVFWAQDSETDAYDIRNLSDIKVSYAGAVNNDESRDAFTAVSKDFTGAAGTVQEIVLRRSVAQINIGTTGADYANLIYGPNMLPKHVSVTESTIKVTDVADRFNAVTGAASASTKNLTADFSWAKLPAWYNTGMPDFLSEGEAYTKDNDPFVNTNLERPEEFLKVKMNGTADPFKPYLTDYPTIKDGEWETETFKYLSMCYVMVPGYVGEDKSTGSILTVEFDLRQKKSETDGSPVNLTPRLVQNVPARANFRTNILGGLFAGSEEEPDPSSIFNYYQLPVILNDKFDADNNAHYYSANLKVSREDPDFDGLEIINGANGEKLDTTDRTDGLMNQVTSLSESIYFSGDEVTIEFKVNPGYVVAFSSNVSIENWSSSYDGNGTYILTIKSGATAGTFTVKVMPDYRE